MGKNIHRLHSSNNTPSVHLHTKFNLKSFGSSGGTHDRQAPLRHPQFALRAKNAHRPTDEVKFMIQRVQKSPFPLSIIRLQKL